MCSLWINLYIVSNLCDNLYIELHRAAVFRYISLDHIDGEYQKRNIKNFDFYSWNNPALTPNTH